MGHHVCPVKSLDENATENLFGNTSFYEFNRILAGACAAFVTLVIWSSMFFHGIRFSKPNEQAKIMRIALLLPAYAIICFLSIYFPAAYVYLDPWLDFAQSIAVASFFLLLCEFVSEDEGERNIFFAALEVPQKKSKRNRGNKPPVDGITWFRRKWFFIFQYPVVSLICAIATDITQAAGIFCQFSSSIHFAHFWIDLALNVSVTFAVGSVIGFYAALKTHLAHHRPLAKLLAFKLVVFLTFIQGILFWILRDTNAMKPNSKLTWADINLGIPNLVICLEMVPLSLFFHYAYSWHPYRIDSSAHGEKYHGGFLGIIAWIMMWDPREIISAIVFAGKIKAEERAMKKQTNTRSRRYENVPVEYDNGYDRV